MRSRLLPDLECVLLINGGGVCLLKIVGDWLLSLLMFDDSFGDLFGVGDLLGFGEGAILS